MNSPHPYQAIDDACASLRARSADKRLLVVPGLADELRAIATAFECLRRASRIQSRVILQKHYGYDMSTTDYHAMVDLAREVKSDDEKSSDRKG